MHTSIMPDTCTARHFYEFPYGDTLDHEWRQSLSRAIVTALNIAKTDRIVNCFAFLTARQHGSKASLEEHGFVCVSDLNNYKYLEDSRRLYTMVRDMNDWEIRPVAGQPPAATNPLARPAAPAPVALAHHGRAHFPDGGRLGYRHYNLGRYLATLRNGRGPFETPLGTETNDPFPVGWEVEIPTNLNIMPPSLMGKNVRCRLQGGVYTVETTANGLAWDAQGDWRIVSVTVVD